MQTRMRGDGGIVVVALDYGAAPKTTAAAEVKYLGSTRRLTACRDSHRVCKNGRSRSGVPGRSLTAI